MKSILVVAAANEARAGLIRRLSQDGYTVTVADDLRQAQRRLAGPCPGAVVPGAIIVDLKTAAARRLVDHLARRSDLQLVPRLLFIDPQEEIGVGVPVAAAFCRPVSPDHLARALVALYPRGKWHLPLPEAVQVSRKRERIKEAIDMVAATPPPPAPELPPATLGLGSRPAADGPSERAISVAYAYAIEAIEERISNDTTTARAATTALPTVVEPAAEANRAALGG